MEKVLYRLRLFNAYCISTATVEARMLLSVTLYVCLKRNLLRQNLIFLKKHNFCRIDFDSHNKCIQTNTFSVVK
jgi:hypothetical protein